MAKLSKRLLFCLIVILAVSSMLIISPVNAQSIAKPSVPEFTVKFVDKSYNVAPRYSYDSYTGKDVLVENGYYIQDKRIELTIKNQPFTSYNDSKGNQIGLYYIIQTRGHFGGSWWSIHDGYYGSGNDYVGPCPDDEFIPLAYGIPGNNGTGLHNLGISEGGKADFRVQAFIGYFSKTTTMTGLGEAYHYDFTGEYSDWSDSQTLTLSNNSDSATPTPSVPELPVTAILTLAAAVPLITALIHRKKHRLFGEL